MMKKLFSITTAVALFILIGCSHIEVEDNNLTSVLNNNKGKHINEIISLWGFPDEDKVIAKRKLYIWKHETVSIEKTGYSNDSYDSSLKRCRIIVEVSDDEVIIGSSFEFSEFSRWECESVFQARFRNRE